MPLPQSLARFNRHVTNPIQRLWAGRLPGFAIIEHTGRTSGRRYRTPVNAFQTESGFVIALTYGRDRDWLKNLLAARGGRMIHRGRTYDVADPVVVPIAEARPDIPEVVAFFLRRLSVDDAVRVSASPVVVTN